MDDVGLAFARALRIDGSAVIAVSAGGVYVAEPVAYYQGVPIVWLGPGEERVIASPVAYLVDDGLTPADVLVSAARQIRGPSALRLLVPWVRPEARQQLDRTFDRVVTIVGRVPVRPPYRGLACVAEACRIVAWSHTNAEASMLEVAPG